jgi:alpha-glucosidase
VWDRSGGTEKGRDGARVPLPWTRDGSSFGFGSDGAWLPQPDIFGLLSVEAQQQEEGSTLALYEVALRLRRQHLPADESLDWLDLRDDVVAFSRSSGLISVTNFGNDPSTLPAGQVIVSTRPVAGRTAQGESTVWLVADNHPG